MTRLSLRQTPAYDVRLDVLANRIEGRNIEFIVNSKRMLAGSIVILILAVSSMAAACDLRCGFAEAQADCHSMRMKAGDSSVAEIETRDAEMAGMAMSPEPSASLADRAAVSSALVMEMHHARIGEMGRCERHSCDEFAACILKSVRHDGSKSRITLAVVPSPVTAHLQTIAHEAGNRITLFNPGDRVPLLVALRV